MIPYGRQLLDEDDIAAAVEVLRGDWLTQGPAVEAFEAAFADAVEARFAVAVSSGTAALHAAAAAAGLGPGDLVATPSLTFVASANCARYVGAEVAFVDVDADTLNLDVAAVPPEASALVAVHYAGLPLDLDDLDPRPRVVIEDAAHALGAVGPHGPVGNCARSDMCAFSLHPVKSITSAEGGMVTTNSAELAERLRTFRNHGMDHARAPEPWAYEIATTGFNYRLSDVHAALGRSQLGKLERFVRTRNELADRYDSSLRDLPLTLPPRAPDGQLHARHLYPVRVADRARVYRELRDAGIGVQVHYVPVHTQPRFTGEHALPATERVAGELLSLPLHPGLSRVEQNRVVQRLQTALRVG